MTDMTALAKTQNVNVTDNNASNDLPPATQAVPRVCLVTGGTGGISGTAGTGQDNDAGDAGSGTKLDLGGGVDGA